MSNTPSPAISNIPPLPVGWHVLTFKVLSGGRLAIVAANADFHAALRSDHEQKTVGESLRVAANATAKILLAQDETLYESVEFRLEQPFPIIEQFPDGRWLIAHAR